MFQRSWVQILALYWMDIFLHVFVVKIVRFVLKRPKINEKEAGVVQFLKSIITR